MQSSLADLRDAAVRALRSGATVVRAGDLIRQATTSWFWYANDGVFLQRMKIEDTGLLGGVTRLEPPGGVRVRPLSLSVGDAWSYHLVSTDGAITIDTTARVASIGQREARDQNRERPTELVTITKVEGNRLAISINQQTSATAWVADTGLTVRLTSESVNAAGRGMEERKSAADAEQEHGDPAGESRARGVAKHPRATRSRELTRGAVGRPPRRKEPGSILTRDGGQGGPRSMLRWCAFFVGLRRRAKGHTKTGSEGLTLHSHQDSALASIVRGPPPLPLNHPSMVFGPVDEEPCIADHLRLHHQLVVAGRSVCLRASSFSCALPGGAEGSVVRHQQWRTHPIRRRDSSAVGRQEAPVQPRRSGRQNVFSPLDALGIPRRALGSPVGNSGALPPADLGDKTPPILVRNEIATVVDYTRLLCLVLVISDGRKHRVAIGRRRLNLRTGTFPAQLRVLRLRDSFGETRRSRTPRRSIGIAPAARRGPRTGRT